MKKILKILFASTLVSVPVGSVISCGSNTHVDKNDTEKKFNLENINIQNGLDKIDMDKDKTILDVKKSIVEVLNLSYNGQYNISLDKDVVVGIYLDANGINATNNYNDLLSQKNIYIQFVANQESNKVKNKSSFIKFEIIKKVFFTDMEIADEVVQQLKNKNITFKNEEIAGVSKELVLKKINTALPESIIINNEIIKNYKKENVSIKIKKVKENDNLSYLTTAVIGYKDTLSKNEVLINVINDTFKIASKILSNMEKTDNVFSANKALVEVQEINNKVLENLKTLGLDNKRFIIAGNSGKIINNINGLSQGEYEYKIYDIENSKNLVNYNNLSSSDNEIFGLKLSTKKLTKYQDLSDKLKDFSQSDDPSISLREISLLNFIPTASLSNFNNPNAIERVLDKINVGNFVDWFFVPTGKYANLMQRVMPTLNKSGIDNDIKGPNKDLWNYINSIANDLLKDNIDVKNGDLKASFSTKIGDDDANISFDIYKLILNILPDLIHFHNYIINNSAINKEENNYLLLFIKYLLDDTKDYIVKVDSETYNDGFSDINKNANNLKTNFDSLLHNMLEPFTATLKNSSERANSGLGSPIDVTINSYGSHKLNWEAISAKQIPSEVIFKKILNNILKPEGGQNVNKPVVVELEIKIYFASFIPWTVKRTFNIDLSALHKTELRSLIKNKLNFGSYFEKSIYETKEGYLFLLGKNKNNTWVEIHSLDNLGEYTDIKFEFRNFIIKILDNNESIIFFEKKLTNLFLTL